MQHFWSLNDASLENVWLTIGSFDGVHKGHQAIIGKLTTGAHGTGALAVVLTFYPHPAVVIRNLERAHYLTSPDEQAELMGELGVDVLITHDFNHHVAQQSAYGFVSNLHHHLDFRHLCVGPDFALGRNREGDIPTLTKLGKEFGFSLDVIEPIKLNGEIVSSSRIRAALMEGDMVKARRLLGRPYSLNGEVVPGDGRGRTLGIPTANIDVWSQRVLPKAGVYACWVKIGEETRMGVSNVGVRPTFEKGRTSPQVETHLLDFDQNLYNYRISISFIERLRDERRFPDVDTLVSQIRSDILRSRDVLEKEIAI